jgi:hypothetical protein
MTPPGVGPTGIAAFKQDPFAMYKIPVFLRMQLMYSMWARVKANTSPTQYELFYVTDTIVTLWNPTDVPLALHPDSYLTFKYWYIPYIFELWNGGTMISSRNSRQVTKGDHNNQQTHRLSVGLPRTKNVNNYFGVTGATDPLVLMPGEVLFLSQEPSSGDPAVFTGAGQGLPNLGLKVGWNLGSGSRHQNPIATVDANADLRVRLIRRMAKLDWSGNPDSVVDTGFYGYGAADGPANWVAPLGGKVVRSTSPGSIGHMFPAYPDGLEEIQLPRPGLMTGRGKHPFLMFSFQTKTEHDVMTDVPTTAWSRMFNPRNTSQSNRLTAQDLAALSDEIHVHTLAGSRDARTPQSGGGNGNRAMFGGSYTDHQTGSDTVITQSIPREPPLSLGAFQHAIAIGNRDNRAVANGALLIGLSVGADLESNMKVVHKAAVSQAVSNSYALPVIPTTQTNSGDYVDHSYQVNRMLWDSWFISGIVQRQAPHHDRKKTARRVYEDLLANPSIPLPNRRMKPTPGAIEAGAEALFEANGDAKADAHEIASTKLMVDGAFNVNSTSVEAWKALLGSMEEAFIPVANGINSPATTAAHRSQDTPVSALLTAYGSGTNRDSAAFDGAAAASADRSTWRGYRKLNKYEIEELAKELVAEIRARGPFLSMADFINRRLSPDNQLALRGPLQAALDRTVNKTLLAAADRVAEGSGYEFKFPEAAKLPKSIATPAHVRQADILTSTGAQLTARSDTFRIRAYGESVDRNGKVLARAWCEAVVQRLPEYVDPADPPHAADPPTPDPEPRTVPSLTSAANKVFGRRIEIVSFSWLSPDE